MKLTIAHDVFTEEDILIEQVGRVVGKSVKTLENWGTQYVTHGIDSLNNFQYTPKQTSLKPTQIEQVVTWVKETNPAKTKQVKAYIQEQCGVAYSVETVRQLLLKQGLKFLRPKTEPGDPPSEDEQRAFVQKYETMKAESDPGTVLAFGDAMHLVHQNEPGFCWGDPRTPPCLKRIVAANV